MISVERIKITKQIQHTLNTAPRSSVNIITLKKKNIFLVDLRLTSLVIHPYLLVICHVHEHQLIYTCTYYIHCKRDKLVLLNTLYEDNYMFFTGGFFNFAFN